MLNAKIQEVQKCTSCIYCTYILAFKSSAGFYFKNTHWPASLFLLHHALNHEHLLLENDSQQPVGYFDLVILKVALEQKKGEQPCHKR